MGLFENAQKDQAGRIWFLSDPEAQAFIGFSGQGRDDELAPGTGLLVQGVKARWPTLGPADGLYYMGRDRDLERFPGESDDAYRGRQKVAFDIHAWDGTAEGIRISLTASCEALGAAAPIVTILENWQGAFADGCDWYSRFTVCIQGGTWVGNQLGVDFVIGESTLGSTATAAEIRSVKRQIRKIKDAHSLPVLVRVALIPAELLGVDWVLGSSALAAPEDVVEWVMMPLLGVDWMLGTSLLGAYNME